MGVPLSQVCWLTSCIDKETYFEKVEAAYSLQNRWKNELGIDVIELVAESLRKASGMVVRLAREDERDYFAGESSSLTGFAYPLGVSLT